MTRLTEINHAKQELTAVENDLSEAEKRLIEMIENEPASPYTALIGAGQIIVSSVMIYLAANLAGKGIDANVFFLFNALFCSYFIYAGAGKIIRQVTARRRRRQLESEIAGMRRLRAVTCLMILPAPA